MVDLLDTKPVQDVRHERLEPHVLHPCDELGRLEVLVSRIATSFAEVIHEVSDKIFCLEGDGIYEGSKEMRYLVTSPSARPSFRK